MDEKQYFYPLDPGASMFNGKSALKVSAYMQAVEPHPENIGMDEAKLMAAYQAAWVLIAMTTEPRRATRPGDRLTLRRLETETDTNVTVALPEMIRPAFAARLRFD